MDERTPPSISLSLFLTLCFPRSLSPTPPPLWNSVPIANISWIKSANVTYYWYANCRTDLFAIWLKRIFSPPPHLPPLFLSSPLRTSINACNDPANQKLHRRNELIKLMIDLFNPAARSRLWNTVQTQLRSFHSSHDSIIEKLNRNAGIN